MKKTWLDPKIRERRIRNSKQRMETQRQDPKFEALLQKAREEKLYSNEEWRKKIGEHSKLFWQSNRSNKERELRSVRKKEEWDSGKLNHVKDHLRELSKKPEVLKIRSKALKKLNADPSFKQAARERGSILVQNMHTPEARAKALIKQKEWWSDPNNRKEVSERSAKKNKDPRFQEYAQGCRKINKETSDKEEREVLKTKLKGKIYE